ncbi:MAG: MATE family efflux transporter [Oscillospiraceae bacterium]|nr:MATE family efflux transporter [Oscillospiraceae bacterium]
MVKDMTRGDPFRLLLSFCIPLISGNIFQQLYSMADTVIVGRALGVKALAAVGSTGSLNFLVIGFVQGLCSGLTIPISQYFGSGDHKNMRRCAANALWLGAAGSVLITAVTLFGCRWLLRVMGTPGDISEKAYEYIVIIFAGIPATLFYNLFSGLLRAVGDSKTPLYFLIFASFVNIALDLWFVLGLGFGVEGAAWATVLSQLVSALLCGMYLCRRFRLLLPQKGEWAAAPALMKKELFIGLPMGLQTSFIALGSVILQVAVNSLGSDYVAAMTAGMRVQGLFIHPMEMIGIAMATYCGQNLGAGYIGRIRQGVRRGMVIITAFAALSWAAVTFGGPCLLGLFVDPGETAVLDRALLLLRIGAACYPLLGVLFILRNSLQGLGFSVQAMASGLMEFTARVFVAFVLVKMWDFLAICLTPPLSWLLADFFLVTAYFYYIRRLQAKAPSPEGPARAR